MTEKSETQREPKHLSPREWQVLEMTSRGMTNGEIAADLQLSIHGVKFHLASIYRKLGVDNRTEAAVAFLRADRISRPSLPDRSPS